MSQDIVQVFELIGVTQIPRAGPGRDNFDRRAFPLFNGGQGLLVLRLVASGEQTLRNPGAAELILLAELASGAGANNRNPWMVRNQMSDLGAIIAQAGDVHGLRWLRSADQRRAGGCEENHRAMN